MFVIIVSEDCDSKESFTTFQSAHLFDLNIPGIDYKSPEPIMFLILMFKIGNNQEEYLNRIKSALEFVVRSTPEATIN